jgi:hypothetical protein
MTWVLWGILLLAQNASFTAVSRARNSGSVKYHILAGLFSNGVWIANMFVIFDQIERAKQSHNVLLITGTIAFYTALTLTGSVLMHYWLLRKEKGKMKVGA